MANSVDRLIKRLSGDTRVLVANGSVFEKGGGFRLYLPAAAIVHYQTWEYADNAISLEAGYHQFRVRKIYADNATVVYAVF